MEEIRNKKKIWGRREEGAGRGAARFLLSMLLAAGLISGCGNSAGTELPAEQTADGSGLEVHFIDVGQADAALVLCDGESMLIDGGNSEDSDVIYTYLEKQKVEELDYMVCTHAHEDHVGGLSGALMYASVDTALAPVTEYDSRAFRNFLEGLEKQGTEITIPEAGDSFSLGSAQVKILGPVRETDETNNTSIVLRIVYGDTSFLFTGDAEREEEEDILDTGEVLKSTVLKVGHHGSDSSTSYPFLREVMPEYGVISVGTGNTYGHPTQEVLSRLSDAGVTVYRTDLQGDIICTSDGAEVTFRTAKDTAPQEGRKPDQEEKEYILNTNTMKFHAPACSSAEEMGPENKKEFKGTREELLEQGYSPCGRCKP